MAWNILDMTDSHGIEHSRHDLILYTHSHNYMYKVLSHIHVQV